jgi:hypothetical protein
LRSGADEVLARLEPEQSVFPEIIRSRTLHTVENPLALLVGIPQCFDRNVRKGLAIPVKHPTCNRTGRHELHNDVGQLLPQTQRYEQTWAVRRSGSVFHPDISIPRGHQSVLSGLKVLKCELACAIRGGGKRLVASGADGAEGDQGLSDGLAGPHFHDIPGNRSLALRSLKQENNCDEKGDPAHLRLIMGEEFRT